MQLKIVKGALHVVTMDGKKEVAQTPAESIKQARQRISDATSMLQSLENSRQREQDRLEDALESGISTAPARRELATVTELLADQQREITDAQADITAIERLIDQHRASELFDQLSANVNRLIQPFNNFLENHHAA